MAELTEAEKFEQAQLWSIYFALRGLRHSPPYLLQAERRLHQELGVEADEEATTPAKQPQGPTRGHLSLVGGEG